MMNSKRILLSRQVGRWFKRGWLLCAVLLTTFFSLTAQGRLGGANGVVTDSAGAVVPGATVTLTNEDTRVVTKTATSTVGEFTFTNVLPGRYKISISAPGFQTFVQTDVNIDIGVSATVSARLSPGNVTQTITVAAAAEALDTASPEPGTTVEPKLLQLIPVELNGAAENVLTAAFNSTPGVYTPPLGTNSKPNSQMGVGQAGGVYIYYNGLPTASQAINIFPPYDFVSEAHVDTTTFDAQWGWSNGDIKLQTRSGTNDLHGDAFYTNRNNFFDSKGFGNAITPSNHENNYSFSVGGPVILPKLYHGRDRTFFYFTFDRFQENSANTGYSTIPTPAMLTGDFSGLYTTNASKVTVIAPIYDPLSPNPLSPQQFTYNGVANVIPPGRISATSKALLAYFLTPNHTGTGPGQLAQNYYYNLVVPFTINEWGISMDEHLTSTQSLNFVMFAYRQFQYVLRYGQVFGPPTGNNPLNSDYEATTPQWEETLNYTNMITPRLIMTAGIGMVTLDQTTQATEPALTIAPQNLAAGPAKGFPGVTFSGIDAPVNLGEGGYYATNYTIDYPTAFNNWQWSRGHHIFAFGGQGLYLHWGSYSCASCVGTFGFSGNTTTDNVSSTPATTFSPNAYAGSPFASFLLGEVDSASISYTPPQAIEWGQYAVYAQDNIKLKPSLTVNVGLRWDIQVPYRVNNNEQDFVTPQSLTTPNPAASGQLGALTAYGDCQYCSGFTRAATHWKELAPRIGFSYAINQRTVVNGGFGLIWTAHNDNIFQTDGNAWGTSTAFTSSGTNTPSFGSWDSNTLNFPPPAAFTSSALAGQSVSFLDPQRAGMNPYIETWTVSFQRELPWSLYFRGDYLGELGIHQMNVLADQLDNIPAGAPAQYGSLLSQKANSTAAQSAGITIPFANFVQLLGSNATVMQALRAYPQYLSIKNAFAYTATNNYSGLAMQLDKRYSNGLFFLLGTTFQREIGTASSQSSNLEVNVLPVNPYNQKPESVVETPSYIVSFSGSYELPFGLGKAFLDRKGIVNDIVGGWQLAGVATYSGGFPYGVTANGSPYGDGNRANRVSTIPIAVNNWSTVKTWTKNGLSGPYPVIIQNNGAFTDPGLYTAGNGSPVYASLRTPPQRNENASMYKNIGISDHVKLMLRVDYFNIFNRWTLLNNTSSTTTKCVDTNVSDGTFGEVTGLCGSGQRQGQATLRLEF